MNAIERLREAIAVGWPEGHHEEPSVFTRADDALTAVDALYQAAEAWAHERRRYIDGEENHPGPLRDREVALVAAVRRVEGQA